MDDRFETVQGAAGVLTPATVFVTFCATAVVTPEYTWPTDPFSFVGTTDGASATAFNAGLVVAGALSLPFAHRLWSTWSRAVGGLYALVGVSLAGAGAFPAASGTVSGSAHELFAVLLFVSIWFLLWAAGVVDWRAGHRRTGATAFALGGVALTVWLPYDLGWRWAQVGYGAAELLVVSAFAVWSVWTVVRLRTHPRPNAVRREGDRLGA